MTVAALAARGLGERARWDQHDVDAESQPEEALAADLAGYLVGRTRDRVGHLTDNDHSLRSCPVSSIEGGEAALAKPLDLEEKGLEVAGVELLPAP